MFIGCEHVNSDARRGWGRGVPDPSCPVTGACELLVIGARDNWSPLEGRHELLTAEQSLQSTI